MLSSIPEIATEETMLYRFACLDAHDNAASTEEIDARSLIDAIAKAHMMLKSRPHHETVDSGTAWPIVRARIALRRRQFNLTQVGAYEGLEVQNGRDERSGRTARPDL